MAKPGERLDWQLAASAVKMIAGPVSILDVGCFDGAFLDQLPNHADKFGIEINESAADKAVKRGIKVIGRDFSALRSTKERFDAVIAMDVIEHVSDPLAFLCDLALVAKPGGLVFISTGSTDALTWRIRGSNYWYCAFAEHISYINPDWCKKAAESLQLRIERLVRFSHLKWRWSPGVKELAANVVHMLSPGLIDLMRRKGLGYRKPIYSLPLRYPPSWTTAKDHIAVIFRKQ